MTSFVNKGKADAKAKAFAVVEKIKHIKTGTILAVKRITGDSQERRHLLVDLDNSMWSSDYKFTLPYYWFREGDVWICIEEMDTFIDKFLGMDETSQSMFYAKLPLQY